MISVAIPLKEIADFCRKNNIARLAVFGSAIKGGVREEGDVDFLVTFEPDAKIGLIRMAHIENELSGIIGKKADLRTPMDLSRYFRQEVLAEAEVVYEKG